MDQNQCPYCGSPCAPGEACRNPSCTMVTDASGIHVPDHPANPAIFPAARSSGTPHAVSIWTDDGHCQRCGEQLQERFKFCPFCGRPRQQIVDPYALVSRHITQPKLPQVGERKPQIRPSSHPDVLRRNRGK